MELRKKKLLCHIAESSRLLGDFPALFACVLGSRDAGNGRRSKGLQIIQGERRTIIGSLVFRAIQSASFASEQPRQSHTHNMRSSVFPLVLSIASAALAFDPLLGFNNFVEVENRTLDEIYQEALKEGGVVTVWHGGYVRDHRSCYAG